jgi:NADPH:quinone reductase-like Zn-dependent oxidoreductase
VEPTNAKKTTGTWTSRRAGARMVALRLHSDTGIAGLSLDEVDVPEPGVGEALVRVHAAAITRDELEWPVDRLPAIPSYELSGAVETVGAGVMELAAGDAVYALTAFDRDGVAAEYALVSADLLAPKPDRLDHVESAAVPMPGLTAWQGLFDHGRLETGQRVLIHGAAGGVGHLATQLAREHGAHVVGTASAAHVHDALQAGAHEAFDRASLAAADLEPVDLVFDTVGGEALAGSAAVLREGGKIVSVAEEPPAELAAQVDASYFVVEPGRREQLVELARLAETGRLRPAIDSVFPLSDAPDAFERVAAPGKRGKVVLRVVESDSS